MTAWTADTWALNPEREKAEGEYFVRMLHPDDHALYDMMCKMFEHPRVVSHRSELELFLQQLAFVNRFVNSRENGKAKRSLAAGVFFPGEYLVIHKTRFAITIRRAESIVYPMIEQACVVRQSAADVVRERLNACKSLLDGIRDENLHPRRWSVWKLGRESGLHSRFASQMPEELNAASPRTIGMDFPDAVAEGSAPSSPARLQEVVDGDEHI